MKNKENIIEKENNTEIETIFINSGAYITDPCYDTNTWCQQLLHNVKSGKWLINYEYDEFKNGETRVILSIAHEDYGMAIFNDFYDNVLDSVELGVDSGCLGIFDEEYYKKHHFNNGIDEDWYDKEICGSNFKRKAYITDGKGVWCSTANGDGEYIAQYYLKNGKVYGIEIEM